MNVKNFIVGGIVGGLANFLLGWVFYGIVFKDIYPESMTPNYLFILLGCMTYGFLVSYVINQWANISQVMEGAKAGALIGFFTSLYMNFFMYSNKEANYTNMILDVAISIVISTAIGAVVAALNGRIKKE
jgi:fluoride ion exporter CrcB/FEX